MSHVLSRGCRCFNLCITKAAWNCCVLLLWMLSYWDTQTSRGECYLFVFLLYKGSVLGPILFLVYINDLPDKVTSQVRLFADDTAMYLTMEGAKNSSVLQQDLDRLSVWESDWDMEFNPSKCQVVQVAGSRKPVSATYVLHGVALETVTCARYLGMDVSSNLSWGSHIDRITGTAHKTLGFVKRNIKTKMSGVREAAYTTLVRPQLEYAAAIWDPHHKDKDRPD